MTESLPLKYIQRRIQFFSGEGGFKKKLSTYLIYFQRHFRGGYNPQTPSPYRSIPHFKSLNIAEYYNQL